MSEDRQVFLVYDWKMIADIVDKCDKVLIVIVSPELSYSESELFHVRKFFDRCQKLALLIADETGNTNAVLETFGLAVRIEGSIIQDHVPVYIETPWGWKGTLILDNPSKVFSKIENDTFYAYEDKGRVSAFVIGDGSIFLNQVFRSNHSDVYIGFARATVEGLCERDCIVLLEASKYQQVNPLSILSALAQEDESFLEMIQLFDPLNLMISLISIVLHPSTWLPPLLNFIDRVIVTLFSLDFMRTLFLVGLSLGFALILALYEEKVRDEPLKDVREVKWYGYEVFRKTIREKSLDKEDFIQLYTIVDSVLKSVTGTSLTSLEAISVLESHGVERNYAKSYWEFMNRYYDRARGRRFWPPVVLWGRIVKKALAQSEEVLKVLGTSLKKLEGLEERRL
ncbi:MAG: hypothetical protein QXN05_01600 [Acidilobaceae archaeon]